MLWLPTLATQGERPMFKRNRPYLQIKKKPMPRLSTDAIYLLALGALTRCGASEENAVPVAESIRDAEVEGIHNVGLGYLPIYCDQLLCGKVNGAAQPSIRSSEGAVIQVDADHGFCHTAFMVAFEDYVALTKQQGVALLSISRSDSAGVVGWFVDRLARQGLVSMLFANASPAVAPWGGTKPFFGTNPIGFGAPRTGNEPIVIDMATSTTALVNVRQAAAEGREIPPGWANDKDGNPTTDPNEGLAGSLAPTGGYKGYALNLIVDILAAGLTGSNWSYQTPSMLGTEGGPSNIGQLFIAIDPTKVGGEELPTRMEAMITALLEQDGVRLPGNRRHQSRMNAERNGVEVARELIDRLEAYGRPS